VEAGRGRHGARGALLDEPADLAAGHRPALEEYYVPATLDWNLWLGSGAGAAVSPRVRTVQWRGFLGLRHGPRSVTWHATSWTPPIGRSISGCLARIEPESTPLFKETAPARSRITYTFRAKGTRPEVRVVWHDGKPVPGAPARGSDDAPWPFDRGGGQLWIGTDGKLVAGTYGDEPQGARPGENRPTSRSPAGPEIPALAGCLRGVDRRL